LQGVVHSIHRHADTSRVLPAMQRDCMHSTCLVRHMGSQRSHLLLLQVLAKVVLASTHPLAWLHADSLLGRRAARQLTCAMQGQKVAAAHTAMDSLSRSFCTSAVPLAVSSSRAASCAGCRPHRASGSTFKRRVGLVPASMARRNVRKCAHARVGSQRQHAATDDQAGTFLVIVGGELGLQRCQQGSARVQQGSAVTIATWCIKR
jgi:hypothetical protein